ncbi:MAG: flagellar motor switch protein FliN [Planctomycetota bacterium]|nr:flagellar motor switch protein FliN [Planctomycetota bacterium]
MKTCPEQNATNGGQTMSMDMENQNPADQLAGNFVNQGLPSDPKDVEKVSAHVPQFANLQDSSTQDQPSAMGRLYDVSVHVAAELGSVQIPIGDVLKLGEGSVLELNRTITEPIDLMAQGVRIARGEVVVIDDCFAIRIKEIEANKN